MLKNVQIGFIGAGNMAQALIGGLLASDTKAQQIHASDPNTDSLHKLSTEHGIHTHQNNRDLVSACDVIVLAVKPQVMHTVIEDLQLDENQIEDKLFISIAAGITTDAITQWGQQKMAIVRAMPNTPALVQAGASGLFANANTSKSQRNHAETIMRAVGITVWLTEEALIDTVTALSGSGPAYFFYFMQALETAAIEAGLDDETARILTLQTAFGAAKLALESPLSPEQLREQVTSPGGTTEQAIMTLNQQQTMAIINKAVKAAQQRAKELAQQLGK